MPNAAPTTASATVSRTSRGLHTVHERLYCSRRPRPDSAVFPSGSFDLAQRAICPGVGRGARRLSEGQAIVEDAPVQEERERRRIVVGSSHVELDRVACEAAPADPPVVTVGRML